MKAILTKVLPCTNTRPRRMKAFDQDGNQFILTGWLAGDFPDGHRAAAEGLCAKMGWKGSLIGGTTKDGMAFVFAEEK